VAIKEPKNVGKIATGSIDIIALIAVNISSGINRRKINKL